LRCFAQGRVGRLKWEDGSNTIERTYSFCCERDRIKISLSTLWEEVSRVDGQRWREREIGECGHLRLILRFESFWSLGRVLCRYEYRSLTVLGCDGETETSNSKSKPWIWSINYLDYWLYFELRPQTCVRWLLCSWESDLVHEIHLKMWAPKCEVSWYRAAAFCILGSSPASLSRNVEFINSVALVLGYLVQSAPTRQEGVTHLCRKSKGWTWCLTITCHSNLESRAQLYYSFMEWSIGLYIEIRISPPTDTLLCFSWPADAVHEGLHES
jgi:hypothetical protein